MTGNRSSVAAFALCWLAACGHDVATGRRCASDEGCGTAKPRSAGAAADSGSAGTPSIIASGGSDSRPGTVRGNDDALTVHIEDIQKITIEIVTLACTGDCADIEAVAQGGNPPYAFEWEDGSQLAKRHVCLDASQTLGVTTTDTATGSGEFHYDAQTAHADLTATVLDCVSDAGGVPAGDATAYWTIWSSVTPGTPGTASGTIALPDGDVEVSYSGEVGGGSATTGMVSTSFAGVIEFAPPETYRSATIAVGPPPSGLIAVSGNPTGLSQTITFSVPVRDPLIAVVSMGSITQAMTWQLDATPTVLSNGMDPIGFTGTLSASDQSLTGSEGSGVVQLAGAFTAITFTTSPEIGLDWCGFTIGIRGRD